MGVYNGAGGKWLGPLGRHPGPARPGLGAPAERACACYGFLGAAQARLHGAKVRVETLEVGEHAQSVEVASKRLL